MPFPGHRRAPCVSRQSRRQPAGAVRRTWRKVVSALAPPGVGPRSILRWRFSTAFCFLLRTSRVKATSWVSGRVFQQLRPQWHPGDPAAQPLLGQT